MKPKEVLELARQNKAQSVDLKFVDLKGKWQHFSIPASKLKEGDFNEGIHFAGSLYIPDPTTATIDPFMTGPALSMLCYSADPVTKELDPLDPRNIARKAENYLQSTGLSDTAFFGPEVEFVVLNNIRFGQENDAGYYYVDPPADNKHAILSEMCVELEKVTIDVTSHNFDSSSAGRARVELKNSPLLNMADRVMWFKYISKNVAGRTGKKVSFMPKPVFGDGGSKMGINVSLWKGERPLFAGNKYAGLSEMAIHFIGGVLRHAGAISAFANPTTNSYRRDPIPLAYSGKNRSLAVHTPMHIATPEKKRVLALFPDTSCNAYLTFSAILMAGIDGIQNRIEPSEPLDKDLSAVPLADIPKTPSRLEDSLKALEEDMSFLTKGGVFSEAVIAKWVKEKMEKEVSEVRTRPVPYEFELYFDV